MTLAITLLAGFLVGWLIAEQIFPKPVEELPVIQEEEVIVPLELELADVTDPWLERCYEDRVIAIVTAYAPLDPNAVEGVCFSGNPRVTATGTLVRRGVAAADFRKLPPGTRIEVPGIEEELVVEDTGASMRNYDGIWIDVFMETRAEAFQWGRQEVEIIIK